jgi:hypothetical protein
MTIQTAKPTLSPTATPIHHQASLIGLMLHGGRRVALYDTRELPLVDPARQGRGVDVAAALGEDLGVPAVEGPVERALVVVALMARVELRDHAGRRARSITGGLRGRFADEGLHPRIVRRDPLEHRLELLDGFEGLRKAGIYKMVYVVQLRIGALLVLTPRLAILSKRGGYVLYLGCGCLRPFRLLLACLLDPGRHSAQALGYVRGIGFKLKPSLLDLNRHRGLLLPRFLDPGRDRGNFGRGEVRSALDPDRERRNLNRSQVRPALLRELAAAGLDEREYTRRRHRQDADDRHED